MLKFVTTTTGNQIHCAEDDNCRTNCHAYVANVVEMSSKDLDTSRLCSKCFPYAEFVVTLLLAIDIVTLDGGSIIEDGNYSSRVWETKRKLMAERNKGASA